MCQNSIFGTLSFNLIRAKSRVLNFCLRQVSIDYLQHRAFFGRPTTSKRLQHGDQVRPINRRKFVFCSNKHALALKQHANGAVIATKQRAID